MLSNDSKKIVEFISDDKKINDKGFKELKELFNHLKSVNNIHDKIVSPIKNLPKLQSPFISQEILFKVHQLKNNHYTILSVNNSKIHVNVYYDKLNINQFVEIILPVISYVAHLIKKVVNEYYINYYIVNDKKLLDHQVIGGLKQGHVNSGSCGSNTVNIWRKEEIIKVTIHELFHLFNCDSRTIDPQSIIKLYQERYNINSTVINTFEAYTEIWANIINCYILCGNDYSNFVKYLSIEKEWCRFQSQKILFINKNIQDINKYTNVLAYFIIRCEIYNNFKEFIKLFSKRICCNSTIYFRFLRNNKVCKKNDKLIENFNKKNNIYKSLRMSAMEYNI